jgi:hypothetical protein
MSGDHNQHQKPDVTPEEEEAWRDLERKERDRLFIKAQHHAGEFAQEFIDRTPHTELGIFTLRKAFEMGFLRGFLYHNEESKDATR